MLDWGFVMQLGWAHTILRSHSHTRYGMRCEWLDGWAKGIGSQRKWIYIFRSDY